jgi:polar amino acid transport system ATP-binding protein
MVFQHFNLFPHKTALENVTEGPIQVLGESKKEAVAEARSLLRTVGMLEYADGFPAALSGGQQQRVAIARALAMKPRAIFFDEPTSALDPEMVGEVLQVIRALVAEGITALIVTHEVAFAREVCDRFIFMENGRIIEEGPSERLLGGAIHSSTQSFLASVL